MPKIRKKRKKVHETTSHIWNLYLSHICLNMMLVTNITHILITQVNLDRIALSKLSKYQGLNVKQ